MKNVSRNKFLLCFRPVVEMDLMLDSEASAVADPSQNRQAVTKYLAVKNKEDTMMPSTNRSSVSDTENSIMLHRPGKKTFSQVIKAIVFEILLAKRVKDRKSIDGASFSSRHNIPSSSPGNLLDTSEGIQETISKCNSVQISTQHISKHQEPEVKPEQERIQMSSSSSSRNAVFLLVISLVVTIFWGKFWAILFTSIWLYFLTHLQPPAGVIVNLESIKRISQKKSRGYKKKVIIEGLLQRKQSRGSFNFSH